MKPQIFVSEEAKKALEGLIENFGNQPHAVVLAWASSNGNTGWAWGIGLHPIAALPAEHCFELAGLKFYFDGPEYSDSRSINGRTIRYESGRFSIEH